MAGSLRSCRNEVIRTVNDRWLQIPGLIEDIGGPLPDIVVAMADGDGLPNENSPKAPWLRVRVQHTQSLSTSVSGRTYKNLGTLLASVFVFRETSGAWNLCDMIADQIKLAVRDHNGHGDVYFRDVAARERPINNGFSQTDVSAGFWWMEFREKGDRQ